MKKFLLIPLVLFMFSQLMSQSITNITYSPANPTPTDTIYFYVDLTFPSSACPSTTPGINTVSLIGLNVNASALHCLGQLAAICSPTDTFRLLPVGVGNYTFKMTLSSGMGPVPCSPGIVPNDTRSASFSVSTVTGLSNEHTNAKIKIAPNPSSGMFKLSNLNNSKIIVYDVLGNSLVNRTNLNKEFKLDLSAYPEGIYLLKIISDHATETHRLLKK